MKQRAHSTVSRWPATSIWQPDPALASRVINGLTLDNVTVPLGSADGSTSATLVFDGTQTLGGSGNLLFGGSSGNAVSIPAGQTLTVAAGITVDGQSGMFGTSAISYNSSGGSIINQGTIAADDAGQPSGAPAGTLNIFTEGGLTNSGTLQASNGGTLMLFRYAGQFPNGGAPTAWSSTGTFSVNNGTLNLGGIFTTADVGNFSRSGGTVNLIGNLTNDNNPGLVLDDETGSWNLLGGEIDGGTITTVGSNVLRAIAGGYEAQGTLDSVILAGTLDQATNNNTTVTVTDGLTLNGVIQLGGSDGTTFGTLRFSGTQTLDGSGTLQFGGSSSNGVAVSAGQTLTVGPGVIITGQNGTLGLSAAQANGARWQHRQRGHDCRQQGRHADRRRRHQLLDGNEYADRRNLGSRRRQHAAPARRQHRQQRDQHLAGRPRRSSLQRQREHRALAGLATNLATGTLTIQNGANLSLVVLANQGTLIIGVGSTFTVTGNYSGAGVAAVNGMLKAANVTVGSSGTLAGSGTVVANVVNHGLVSPGNSPGILTVTGNYTQGSDGVLNLEIGGAMPGSDYDQLNVSGVATLDGRGEH